MRRAKKVLHVNDPYDITLLKNNYKWVKWAKWAKWTDFDTREISAEYYSIFYIIHGIACSNARVIIACSNARAIIACSNARHNIYCTITFILCY